MAALPAQVAHARAHAPPACANASPAWTRPAITPAPALARLPVRARTSCSSGSAPRARATPSAASRRSAGARGRRRSARARVLSPGPIYEPEGARPDYWRMGRAMFAAGFRAGDLVHNSFSYHLTPAGAMMEGGAHARSAAPCSRRASARPSCSCRRSPTCSPTPTSARRASCASWSRRPTRPAVDSAARCRRPRSAARRFPPALRDWLAGARHRRLPELRHRRPRPDRLRDRGARGPGASTKA